jgi:hypothetical protein
VGAPSGAIETETFGLDVASRTDDARLHIPVEAGRTTSGQVLVWNKEAMPLTLRLSVLPATVDADGRAKLGGDDLEAVGWIAIDEEVELEAEERRTVDVEVRAPRKLDRAVRTVAIVAEPAVEGEQPAIVQRLALTTYLEPDEDSLIASLGPFPWIALAVLLVVATALVRSGVRRRRVGSDPPVG